MFSLLFHYSYFLMDNVEQNDERVNTFNIFRLEPLLSLLSHLIQVGLISTTPWYTVFFLLLNMFLFHVQDHVEQKNKSIGYRFAELNSIYALESILVRVEAIRTA
jgi:hypothetical protein